MNHHNDFQEFETLFWQMSLRVGNIWKNIYAKTFPGSQSRIMHMLDKNGPQKMSELASALNITAGAVTTAATILIEQDYITRLRNNQDRRVIRLALTDKGRKTLAILQNEGRETMQYVFQDMSAEELNKINRIFKRALNNIDRL